MHLMRRQFTMPASLQDEMTELLRRSFGQSYTSPMGESTGWVPIINLEETDDNVIVTCELPGLDPKNVQLSIQDRELLISGEKKSIRNEKTGTCHLEEIACGSFHRRITLPAAVVSDKTAADYKNGFLRITMPKASESKTRKIPITITG